MSDTHLTKVRLFFGQPSYNFQFSLWKTNGRPLARGESRRFDRLETTLWLSIAAGQQLAGDGPLSEVNSIVGM